MMPPETLARQHRTITYDDCLALRTKCRAGVRSSIIAILTITAPILFALIGYAFVTSRAQGERDSTQDARISNNERQINQNLQLLREDLQELKTMLRQR
jgi:hypothetical protein